MTVTQAPTDSAGLRARFDAELIAFLDRQDPDWPDGAPRGVFTTLRRFVLAGGKRLRPLFCYWGWRGAGGPDGTPIVVAAAALELFHAFALIHDDILDGSDRRRGEPSVHRIFADLHTRSSWRGDPEAYGRNTALLCGDLCAAWSDQMFHECGLDPETVHRGYAVFSLMRTEVIAGEYLDLVSGVGGGSVASALTVIRMKAARYTVTRPLQIGAALAGAPAELLDALAEFGDPLGDAFQLRDDVLGVFGDPAVTGKSVLDDLREGKPTVMMALARDAADRSQSSRLRELFGNPDLDAEGAAELRTIIVSAGALEKIEQMIQVRAEAALATLEHMALTPESRAALAALATQAVDRQR
ncbi:geranylgeranyl diphosphate synthase, type I [Micromonospora phaseoli]|uniref:Geranylgeranyl diphosphate synthase, type I n=1 Tax=Micromonospora phaseoli TaxID=1144548 RepID=A0A1H7CM58_9ACTN|nr:polyprenyl synthetase family protein [Micromonospora phaseoli]PZV97858.1 geranylgeranyl diphosphate synthase type I [Micromonospora phaseoli]GIJ78406.1 geranylgeranyl pyrophosphate synthase [Micromonospora phaseoli]SEJ88212.1 geranylgeranyl diphosphate synthase, type I [Micromonospora phaseoli]